MRISDLQAFVDVVEAGGMTQAASIKGVSQPGLSRIIRDIESDMHAMLLRRTGRGVEPTPAGAEFLTFAKSCLAGLEDTRHRLRELSGVLPDTLRIAIPPRLGAIVFPVLYRRFTQELPEIALNASEALTSDMARGMNEERFDLLVSYLASTPGSGEGKPVYRERLYLVQSRLMSHGDTSPVAMAEVAGQPILLTDPANLYFRLIDGAFSSAGYELNVVREMETAEALLAFVAEGEGPGILPYSNFVAEAERGDVIGREIADPPIERSVFIHAGRHLEPRTVRLATSIVQRSLEEVAARVRWQRTD